MGKTDRGPKQLGCAKYKSKCREFRLHQFSFFASRNAGRRCAKVLGVFTKEHTK